MDRRGFTLFEMTVVMTIIALLAAGIVLSKTMIEGFKVRAAIGQIEKYKTAVTTFRIKYGALPGDLTSDDADDLGFQPTTRDDVHVTHGNDYLEDGSNLNSQTLSYINYEILLFWRDLASAGLIEGGFTRATMTFGVAANLNSSAINQFLPASALGNGTSVVAYGSSGGAGRGLTSVSVARGNYFQLAGISTVGGGAVSIENSITPAQAQAIDSKIDDGVFFSGRVMSSDFHRTPVGTTEMIWPFCIQTFADGYYSPANQCATVAKGYRIDAFANVPSCQLSFRF